MVTDMRLLAFCFGANVLSGPSFGFLLLSSFLISVTIARMVSVAPLSYPLRLISHFLSLHLFFILYFSYLPRSFFWADS